MEGCTTRTHSAGLCGTLGPHLSLVDLSVVHRFMAFQVASGNEQRMRADVSELVYRARAVSTVGRQKALVAPLPDYLRCVPVLGSRFDNGCANCGSMEARRSPAVRRCRSLRHHRRSFAQHCYHQDENSPQSSRNDWLNISIALTGPRSGFSGRMVYTETREWRVVGPAKHFGKGLMRWSAAE